MSEDQKEFYDVIRHMVSLVLSLEGPVDRYSMCCHWMGTG